MGRYRLGADIEADAFAMTEIDLVRRVGNDYEIGLCQGMSGAVEHVRSTTPLEAFTRYGAVSIPLPQEGKVRVEIGTSTFVVTRRTIGSRHAITLRERLRWLASGTAHRLLRAAAVGVPVAALATLLGSVPAALAVTDLEGRWAIPRTATPLEVERLIRAKAQFETPSLHQCFDPLPLSCHRPGFVGVGLSISREGEVLSHWISRSTYDEEELPGDDLHGEGGVDLVVLSHARAHERGVAHPGQADSPGRRIRCRDRRERRCHQSARGRRGLWLSRLGRGIGAVLTGAWGPESPVSEDASKRALELLRATHQFPCEYHLSVITLSEEQVFVDLQAAVEHGLAAAPGCDRLRAGAQQRRQVHQSPIQDPLQLRRGRPGPVRPPLQGEGRRDHALTLRVPGERRGRASGNDRLI